MNRVNQMTNLEWKRISKGRSIRRAPVRQVEDAGIVLVLVTIALTVIVGMAAIAIDLGTAYSSSRQMQNSSDNASLAATKVLQCYDVEANAASPLYDPSAASQYGCASGVTSAQVQTTADTVAKSDNGASSEICEVIEAYGTTPTAPYPSTPIAPCSPASGWDTNGNADGVYVSSSTSQTARFGAAIPAPGQKTTSISEVRQASSTIQSITGVGPASGIILVCAGVDASTQQMDVNTQDNVPSLVNYDSSTQTYSLNATLATSTSVVNGKTTYNGPVYNPSLGAPVLELHGPQVDECGLGSNGWKGIGNDNVTLPSWLPITTGDRAGPTRVSISGQPGCSASDLSSDPTGCVLLLPICTQSNGGSGSNGQLYCVTWGAFELLNASVHGGSGNEQYLGFLGTGTASVGQTGSGPPTKDSVVVVQLVQ
jgi:Flp pilus assembly protein TadG